MGSQSDPGLLTRSGGRCLVDLADVAKRSIDGEAVSWTVLASTTTVEAHVDRLIKALVDGSGVGDSRFGAAVLDEMRSALLTRKANLLWSGCGVADFWLAE